MGHVCKKPVVGVVVKNIVIAFGKCVAVNIAEENGLELIVNLFAKHVEFQHVQGYRACNIVKIIGEGTVVINFINLAQKHFSQ